MRILLTESVGYPPLTPYYLEALGEIAAARGWQYDFFDEYPYFKSILPGLWRRVTDRLARFRLERAREAVNIALLKRARAFRPDILIAVNSKPFLPSTYRTIKTELGTTLVNIPTDDPYNPVVSPQSFRESVGEFDLYACPKRAVLADLKRDGCAKVVYVHYQYKRSVFFPEQPASSKEASKFSSDVAMIATCDSKRAAFFTELTECLPALRLALYGGGWNRYRRLRGYWRGMATGRDFRLAMSSTKIALSPIRRSNRDDHSERSFQIPACGAFMLAERSDTHLELFQEGKEAAFFGSLDELVEKVAYYLQHEDQRRKIAEAGHRRVMAGPFSDLDRLTEVLDTAQQILVARTESAPESIVRTSAETL
jgi:hypothetical protein